MNLKDLLVESKIRSRWRSEALMRYKDLISEVKDKKFSHTNTKLPKDRDQLYKNYDSGKDIYLEVSLNDDINVRFKVTSDMSGEVEGFVDVKEKRKKYGIKKVDSVLIGLYMLSFNVLDGIYADKNPVEGVKKYIVQSLTKENKKYGSWPNKEKMLRTFVHEYIEFKKNDDR